MQCQHKTDKTKTKPCCRLHYNKFILILWRIFLLWLQPKMKGNTYFGNLLKPACFGIVIIFSLCQGKYFLSNPVIKCAVHYGCLWRYMNDGNVWFRQTPVRIRGTLFVLMIYICEFEGNLLKLVTTLLVKYIVKIISVFMINKNVNIFPLVGKAFGKVKCSKLANFWTVTGLMKWNKTSLS